MLKKMKANQVVNGSFGLLWIDNEKLSNVKSFEAKVGLNYEEVNIAEDLGTHQKLMGYAGSGTMTLHKVDSFVLKKMKDGLAKQNEMDGPVFKIKDDPRITRIGKFLRTTSIDELLQLFNVLKGDMSLVGPRPPLIEEVALYDDYQKLRLVVTPGLTCFWQTANDRNDISFNDWVEMDINYIETRTFWLDIKIIARTILVVITREGR